MSWIDTPLVREVREDLSSFEETLRALDDLVHQGKVRYLGCSNYPDCRYTRPVLTAGADGDGDGQLALSLEGDSTRNLGPDARSVLRYRATTDQPGVHNVRLTVTSADGVALGSVGELPIRAAQVSALIWIAMAAGALVLFGMIGYRLPGQIRARRAELAAQHEATDPTDAPVGHPVPEAQ